MVRVGVARSVAEIERLRSAWESVQSAERCTMFQSYAWNRLAAAVFARREAPFVVSAESDSGVALIPAAITIPHRRISFFGESLFDYRDVVAAGDPQVLQAAWARVAELRLPLSVTALRGDGARAGWSEFEPQFFVNAPRIGRDECSGAMLAAAHRRLGRFWRRAMRSGAELRRHDGAASELLRWIYEQKAAHLGPCAENLFSDRLRIEFIVAVAAANPAMCDVFALERDGHVMAALVTFRDREVRRFYTVYYDQRFAHYSPGNLLLFEVCRHTLDEGLSCDFMTGEQPYKRRLATSVVPLFRVEASAEMVAEAAGEPIDEVAA